MKYLAVETGQSAQKDVHYKYGTLIGTIKSTLLYSDMSEEAFKVNFRALLEVLDPYNMFDKNTISQLVKHAESKGFTVNQIVKELNLLHE
jgi:hypothetical protein